MQKYIEFFDSLPYAVVFTLMLIFCVMQGIGEFLEFKGRVVPEFMKIRKAFSRRRQEKETLRRMTDLLPSIEVSIERVPEVLEKATTLLESVDCHYSHDNITMRNNWMKRVDDNIDEVHRGLQELNDKLDKNSEDTLAIRVENMRDTIIDFAAYVSKDHNPVTREQFNRIFRMHQEYEGIIEASGRTNGEVDIAIKIIKCSYEKHLCAYSFIEDSWGNA